MNEIKAIQRFSDSAILREEIERLKLNRIDN